MGIQISLRCSSLYEDNYLKLFKELYRDLEIWSKAHLSLLGRIATLKMNVLPKILSLFQHLPILSSFKIFHELDQKIRNFIWLCKKPPQELNINSSRQNWKWRPYTAKLVLILPCAKPCMDQRMDNPVRSKNLDSGRPQPSLGLALLSMNSFKQNTKHFYGTLD